MHPDKLAEVIAVNLQHKDITLLIDFLNNSHDVYFIGKPISVPKAATSWSGASRNLNPELVKLLTTALTTLQKELEAKIAAL